jgi:hypothetical protein
MGKLADRSGYRLAIDAGPASNVDQRGLGGPPWLRVAVQDQPNRHFGTAQVGHARINESVEDLEAEPGFALRRLPPGGRGGLAHGSVSSES